MNAFENQNTNNEELLLGNMKNALTNTNVSNVTEVIKVLDEARKLSNQDIMEKLYKMISEDLSMYPKLYEILRVKLVETNKVIDTLNRLHGNRTKESWIRNKLNSLNSLDVDKLKNNPLTKNIYNTLPSGELPMNIFDINNNSSPFYFTKELKNNLVSDIEWLKKYKPNEAKSRLDRFKEVFLK